jgi:TRAP-type transport system periplasmic protein
MKFKYKTFSLLMAGFLSVSSVAQSAEVTLRFAHFWPATAGLAKTLESWGKTVEEESKGRIKVDVFPSQTLVKATQTYESVKNGITDVGATIQGYSANRFVRTQLVELPGIVKSAKQGSCIVQTLFNEGAFGNEYDDTHPLFMFTHGPGHIHTKDKVISTPDDLKALLIRRPTVVVGELLSGLGAEPIGISAPEMYGAMSRGVVSGLSLPWEAMSSFRLNELAQKHTEIGLYSIAFVVTMNKQVYASLPSDLKEIIDRNSGLLWAEKLGNSYDNLDIIGRQNAVALGHEITTIVGGTNNPAWKPKLDLAVSNYLQGLESKGIDAQKIVERAKALDATCQ